MTLTAKGEATRSRIIEGASATIRELGALATTLDDIRARTRTSKSQLFHYFPEGKEQLLLAVARHEAAQVLTDQEPYLGRLATWDDWLAWRDVTVERYRRQGPNCALSAVMSQVRHTPGASVVVAELMESWQEAIRRGVVRLQDAGEADPSLDPTQVARAVIAAIQGGVSVLMSTGSADHLEAGLDLLLQQLRGNVMRGGR